MTIETHKTLLKMKECGCRKNIVVAYEKGIELKQNTNMIQEFKKYRDELQMEFDEACKCIDYIDYMIYEIEKNTVGRRKP